jgi:hypothetical protein
MNPEPLKRKVTPEETRERKKQYEKNRECKFIDSWKQDRPLEIQKNIYIALLVHWLRCTSCRP